VNFYIDAFRSALGLIWSLDPELIEIVGVSLQVSATSTLIAALVGIPLGLLVALGEFKAKRVVITILNTLLALPTVVIGLFVYGVISRRGMLGSLELLYTPWAIVIGQIFLVIPIVTIFTITAVNRVDERYRRTAMTLGAGPVHTGLVILREARLGILAAVAAAFGRVIAEIGISMMLGGNIEGVTRTMTTAMAMQYDKGEFVLAVALGLVLLTICLGLNAGLNALLGRTRP
jgi:tungstate transport system permease protein